MFYLMTLNTFFLTVQWRQTHGKGSLRYQERKPAAGTWDILSDWQQEIFYMNHPINRIAYTTAVVTPVVEHWLEQMRRLNYECQEFASEMSFIRNTALQDISSSSANLRTRQI